MWAILPETYYDWKLGSDHIHKKKATFFLLPVRVSP